ncbi:MAG: isoamylase early set domain-containing protein [Sphaerochaetaceae bacterium]|jgi:hypothetical protein|nr:isoamylase early set domain-containing protein [Sphaerochaetaceae bacterium]MDD3941882.1 isoamylase early set domain-containing protein [Sphaerochaetaceae bacterium]MDX9939220.1 isoamylase early set domain-containing protein [Sphaerochaetaceae bacterium]
MDCNECKACIDRWLDACLSGEWTDGPDHHLDRRISDHLSRCPDCKLHLELAERIVGTSIRKESTSPELVRRVSDSVLVRIQEEQRFSQARTHRGSHVQKYLVVAAALVMITLPLLKKGDGGFVQGKDPGTDLAQVILRLDAPQAEQVVVVGDWNDWEVGAQRLAKSENDRTWSIEMELERGKEYRYQFVIDGERWIADPNAYMQVDDGFGGVNSLLEM